MITPIVVVLLTGERAMAAHGATCSLHDIGTGHVVQVIDGHSFRLGDGRDIRLAGIDVPLMARAGEPPFAAADVSKAALETLVGDKDVILKAAQDETDRYGRLVAYAFIPNVAQPVQHTLLAQGQARVALRITEPACRSELLAQENIARAGKSGLWADPLYAVRQADPAQALASDRGRYVVIEGTVWSVRTSGSTTYMNFARRWSQGFAVTIRKRDQRAFAAAGMTPKMLEGKRVRIRGFLEQRSGPRIEATDPWQIELAER